MAVWASQMGDDSMTGVCGDVWGGHRRLLAGCPGKLLGCRPRPVSVFCLYKLVCGSFLTPRSSELGVLTEKDCHECG